MSVFQQTSRISFEIKHNARSIKENQKGDK